MVAGPPSADGGQSIASPRHPSGPHGRGGSLNGSASFRRPSFDVASFVSFAPGSGGCSASRCRAARPSVGGRLSIGGKGTAECVSVPTDVDGTRETICACAERTNMHEQKKTAPRSGDATERSHARRTNGLPLRNENPARENCRRRIGLLTFIRLLIFRSIEHLAFCNTSSPLRSRITGIAPYEAALDKHLVAATYVTTARWNRRSAIAVRSACVPSKPHGSRHASTVLITLYCRLRHGFYTTHPSLGDESTNMECIFFATDSITE